MFPETKLSTQCSFLKTIWVKCSASVARYFDLPDRRVDLIILLWLEKVVNGVVK